MILDGIRVLDFTQYLAGPSATRLMAEMGAEVIKIEQAPGGDPGRAIPCVRDGRSGFFVQQNRGKKSLCLDFNSSDGQAIVRDLVPTVDVVIENSGPGVMEKRGFTYDAFSKLNPGLVMVSVSAFGRVSPLAHRTGYDWIAQAFSGLMHMTGPEGGIPHPVGIGICDSNAGVHAFAAIGYALMHKLRTGEGQYIDLSMVDAVYHMHEYNVHGRAVLGEAFETGRMGAHHNLIAPFGVFRGPQGYIVIAVLPAQWPGLCKAMGRPELETDPRFAELADRASRRDELVSIIEDWTAGFDDDDAVVLALEKFRVPAARVMDPVDTLTHPYFVERGMVRDVEDPVLGTVQVPGFPFKFSAQTEELEATAPMLGEHAVEVLNAIGYDDERIRDLAANGTLTTP